MVVDFPGYLLLAWGWCNTGFVVFWGGLRVGVLLCVARVVGWGFVVRCVGGGF